MDDFGISLSQIQSTAPRPYGTPALSPSPTPPQTPQQPIRQGITRRPTKRPNPNPAQISDKLAQLDDEIVDTFSRLAELVDIGISLIKNETDGRFFYDRMQELRDDFDTLIIIKRGGRRKTRKSKSKSKRK
jgi:hypothetical protein